MAPARPARAAASAARRCAAWAKEYEHPAVGRLSLPIETLTLLGRPDLMLSVLTSEPGSESAQRVRPAARLIPFRDRSSATFLVAPWASVLAASWASLRLPWASLQVTVS
ncbi:hypothetical protein ACFU6I_47250 [Streptomyces sp. NPDC057486]|uniref:MmyB family transcriptional regulator n=1 Tax=Streptomyces sp. NPDC057486 TaxID=3346145 RepID=UPI0036CD01DC